MDIKTEFDKIPIDWDVDNLDAIAWFQEGPGIRNWQFKDNGIKVINVTNLVNGYLDLSKTNRYIDIKEVEKKYKHFLIDNNDIVVASSGNSWGKVSIVRKQDLPLLMNTSVIRFKSKDQTKLCEDYLISFLKSDLFREQIKVLITGSAQPNFGPYHLKQVEIALPSIQEQENISEILSSNEALITKTDELIEKNMEIKQGLIQTLLTRGIGHTEFKDSYLGEIPKNWKIYSAGQIFESVSTKNHPEERILTVTQDRGTIYREDCGISIKTVNTNLKSFKLVQPGNFIISLRSFQGGIEFTNLRGIVSPAYTVLNRVKEINDIFFKYFFKSERFINILDSAVIGIRDGKQISYEVFKTLKIPYPPINEQGEIASILFTLDEKIEALSKRKQHLEEVKKGLMQDLLTGRVRVNTN